MVHAGEGGGWARMGTDEGEEVSYEPILKGEPTGLADELGLK